MNCMRKLWLIVLMVALLGGLSAIVQSASASYIAYDSTRPTGNQYWYGSLGMDFDVNAPIRILELGAYDSGQDGIAGSGISVGIFDRNTQALVGSSALITTSDPLTGYSRYADITDFVLGPGSYSIVAQGYLNDPNGNTGFYGTGPTMNTGGGLISFVGSSRYDYPTSLDFPTFIDGGPANRYDAGTFKFEAVPEPATMLLLGLGLIGVAGTRRKFKA